jgi:hypothetical protein
MSAHELVAAIRRRWYVLAMVLVCTLAGIGLVHKRSISYEACNALFVTEPPTHVDPNVYTNESGSLDSMTGLVTRALMSSAVQQQVRAEGLGTYDAEMTNTGSNETPVYGEPSLEICSIATNADLPVPTTAAATKQFQVILRERQLEQQVPAKLLIGVTVTASPYAAPIYGRPSQAYLGVGLLGLVASVPITLWSDPVLERRRRRRGKRSRASTRFAERRL